MPKNFLEELNLRGHLTGPTGKVRSNADQLRSSLHSYSQKQGWSFHQAFSAGDIKNYRQILNRPDAPLRRLVGMRSRAGKVDIVAPTELMRVKYAQHFAEDIGRPIAGERLDKFVAVMQTHETAEAFARSRGATGKFGSHASEDVIHAEIEAAKWAGSKTVKDVHAFRTWEVTELTKRGFTDPHWQTYQKRMGEILTPLENYGDIPPVKVPPPTTLQKALSKLPSKSPFTRGHIAVGLALGLGAAYIASEISGNDDDYNTIEGLLHGGEAQKKRVEHTDFGSGWDPIRTMARAANMSFKVFLNKKSFQTAIQEAKTVKFLGKGGFAEAHLMEAELAGTKFQFVKKTERADIGKIGSNEYWQDFAREAKAQSAFSEKFAPSIYTSSEKEILMEYMPGSSLASFVKKGHKVPVAEMTHVESQIQEIAKKGYINQDIALRNIMYNPAGKAGERVSIIDYGLTFKQGQQKPWLVKSTEEQITTLRQEISQSGRFAYSRTRYPAEEIVKFQTPPVDPFNPPTIPSTRLPTKINSTVIKRTGSPARAALVRSSKDLYRAQRRIWEAAQDGGRGHNRRTKSIVG